LTCSYVIFNSPKQKSKVKKKTALNNHCCTKWQKSTLSGIYTF